MSRRDDDEIMVIRKIMALLGPMPPVARARVLDYVVSRVESLGLVSPARRAAVAAAAEDMFAEVVPAADRRASWGEPS